MRNMSMELKTHRCQRRLGLDRDYEYAPQNGSYLSGNSDLLYSEQVMKQWDQLLAEYEETLRSLQKGSADFHASFRILRRLRPDIRKRYVNEWKDYLQDLQEKSRQLAVSLEDAIQSINCGLKSS